MSIRTIVVTVECDICGQRVDVEPVNLQHVDSQVDTILAQERWWSRTDFSDVCPKHPNPESAA